MNFLVEKISKLKTGWNIRSLTEDDFYRLCRRSKVGVEEMPLCVSGFYYCVKGRHFIAIDSKLAPKQKLFVMFHEFAHFLMHAPDVGVTANFHGVGRRTRKESEADAIALCALIPRSWLETRSHQEIIDEESISPEMLRARAELYSKTGV